MSGLDGDSPVHCGHKPNSAQVSFQLTTTTSTYILVTIDSSDSAFSAGSTNALWSFQNGNTTSKSWLNDSDYQNEGIIIARERSPRDRETGSKNEKGVSYLRWYIMRDECIEACYRAIGWVVHDNGCSGFIVSELTVRLHALTGRGSEVASRSDGSKMDGNQGTHLGIWDMGNVRYCFRSSPHHGKHARGALVMMVFKQWLSGQSRHTHRNRQQRKKVTRQADDDLSWWSCIFFKRRRSRLEKNSERKR